MCYLVYMSAFLSNPFHIDKTKKYIIYALIDPITLDVRYVGKSQSGYKRCLQHKKPTNLIANNHKTHWIQSLLKKNLVYYYSILEYVVIETPEFLNSREDYWIQYYRALSPRLLTNSQNGGDGSPGRTLSEYSKKLISSKKTSFYEKLKRENKFLDYLGTQYTIKIINGVQQKHCYKCNKFKPINEFYKNNKRLIKIQSSCKKCSDSIRVALRSNLKKEIATHRITDTKGNKLKKCIKCLLYKQEHDYHGAKRAFDGKHPKCKQCDHRTKHGQTQK